MIKFSFSPLFIDNRVDTSDCGLIRFSTIDARGRSVENIGFYYSDANGVLGILGVSLKGG